MSAIYPSVSGEEEEEEDEPERKTKVVVKGRAPVDPKSGKATTHRVYHDEATDCVWDCMLNQTNIAQNNNK